MLEAFWQERWRNNQIGFHQGEANAYLTRHWPSLGLETGSTILVPLCGKSLDMDWLLGQGLQVIGVELVEQAVRDFFEERHLVPEIVQHRDFRIYRVDALEIWCGDFFALTPADVVTCKAFYDRAALIALPPEMRVRYVEALERLLPASSLGLLVTLDYEQSAMQGPPFAVTDTEVLERFGRAWHVQVLERTDVMGENWKFVQRGLSSLDEVTYRLIKQR